jgi:hypothetical protein
MTFFQDVVTPDSIAQTGGVDLRVHLLGSALVVTLLLGLADLEGLDLAVFNPSQIQEVVLEEVMSFNKVQLLKLSTGEK